MKLNQQKQNEEKAQETMLPFLEEQLVRVTSINLRSLGNPKWGIVVPLSLIKTYCKSYKSYRNLENRIWAIWKDTREEAIEAYETATENILRPCPDGCLTYFNLRDWQIEIIENKDNDSN